MRLNSINVNLLKCYILLKCFNLKHAKARNCIERSFGTLKVRWGILRSNSCYPIKTQNRFFLGCCLLHNFIRTHMSVDPYEDDVLETFS
ncbi:hypothetical protein ACS0TY_023720 [Phlomoides rotata]